MSRLLVLVSVLCLMGGCASSVMQTPQPVKEGDIAASASVNLYPSYFALQSRASLGLGGGAEVHAMGSLSPIIERTSDQYLEGEDGIPRPAYWSLGLGGAYGWELDNQNALKLSFDQELKTFVYTDWGDYDGPTETYLLDSVVSLMFSSNNREGFDGYIGLKAIFLYLMSREADSFCPGYGDENQGYDDCKSASTAFTDGDSLQLWAGLVAGFQYWVIRDEVALQLEVASQYPFVELHEYYVSTLSYNIAQLSFGVVMHTDLF